jgi:hypothetical protein
MHGIRRIKPKGLQDLLIVDVANVSIEWGPDSRPRDQSGVMSRYLKFRTAHYADFISANGKDGTSVIYVIKNYRTTNKNAIYTEMISPQTIKAMKKFTRGKSAQIAIAEDYAKIPYAKWKKHHYLRGRDDYLCFILAQNYKKQYVSTHIMSNDKFRDFPHFGKVPPFATTFIHNGNSEVFTVRPRPNQLGQFKDYTRVKFDMKFVM